MLTRTPGGLFGLVMKTSRVRGVIAERRPVTGSLKSGSGITSTRSPPTARVVTPYMSNAGRGTITSGRNALLPATVSRATATTATKIPSSRPLVSVTCSRGTPRYVAASRSTDA
jgi:hypothetical protein